LAGPLWTILDAQRQELFAARFSAGTSDEYTEPATMIVPQDAWLAELKPGDSVAGLPLRRLAPRLPEGVTAVAAELWQPTAAAVGQLAWQMYQRGRRDDVWKLVPKYYRPSAAEEKLSKK
jgi:tRNA A37 threonylcarbamoyladenosine modification protein TsaB